MALESKMHTYDRRRETTAAKRLGRREIALLKRIRQFGGWRGFYSFPVGLMSKKPGTKPQLTNMQLADVAKELALKGLVQLKVGKNQSNPP
jgi:hypothetical protein